MTKSGVKQTTYRNVCQTFDMLKTEAQQIIANIHAQTQNKHEDISLYVEDVNEREFHVKVAGDLLAFYLHTNIIRLSDDYAYNKSPYVQEDENRKYLGQINVYNFMADSLKYQRVNDPGYLLARVLVNCENKYIVEGDRQVNFMFEAQPVREVEPTDVNILIHLLIRQAIENDLVAPPFHQIRGLTLQQKLMSTEVTGQGQKIGFQMSSAQQD